MIFVFNRDEEYIGQYDIKTKLTKGINEIYTLEFESTEIFEKDFRVVCKDGILWHEFIITDINYSRENLYSSSYYCEDSIIELSSEIILDKRPEGNWESVLNVVLDGSRFELLGKSNTNFGVKYTNSFFRINKLKAFQETINKYDIEFATRVEVQNNKVIKRIIEIVELGSDSPSRLAFNKNIKKFTRRILADDIYTRLYPFGKGEQVTDDEGNVTGGYGRRIDISDVNDGKPYIEDERALKLYGLGSKDNKRHRSTAVIFEDVEDKNELKEKAIKRLEELSKPKAEYTVEAVNLGITAGLGDRIQVVDEEIDFREQVRIIKEVVEDGFREYTFGFVQKGFTDSISQRIREEAEPIKEEVGTLLEQSLKNIKGNFLKEDGYNYTLTAGNEFGLPAGLYSFEKPINDGPLKAIYIGAGKVLIWTRKNNSSQWELNTAIDEKGINGEAIVSNSITVNKLAADVGQSLDLSSNEYIQSIVSNNSDISDEVYKKISELNNLLEDKISESTINELLEEINNQLNVNSTKINQNENKLEIEFNSIKAEVDNNRADLNTLTSTITSGQDDDGNSYTEWGSTGDAKVRVGANGIDIISNDQEVMSFKDGEAYAKALYVTETIGFGNHTAQKHGTKYTVFSWNGGK